MSQNEQICVATYARLLGNQKFTALIPTPRYALPTDPILTLYN